MIGLSDAAFRLHVEAICYSNRQLTDGSIPRGLVNSRKEAAAELSGAGLWHESPVGYTIHDYDQYQRSSTEILRVAAGDQQSKAAGGRARAAGAKRNQQGRFIRAGGTSTAPSSGTSARTSSGTSSDQLAPAKELRTKNKEQLQTQDQLPSALSTSNGSKSRKGSKLEKRLAQDQLANPLFEEFWAVYPKKAGKAASREAWEKATAMGVDAAIIIDGAMRYRDNPNRGSLKYTKDPLTWLNGVHWLDDYTPEQRASGLFLASLAFADELEREGR